MSSYYKKYIKYKKMYIGMKGGIHENKNENNNKNQYEIHVSEPWYSLLKSGKKTVEGRLNKGIFEKLEVGDIVVWFTMDKETREKIEFSSEIVDKIKYNTFEKMLETEGLENVLPNHNGIKTIEDGVNVYRRWYSEDMEKKFGVIAIKIKLL